MKVFDILASLYERCPLETAETWDQVGLILGDPQASTSGVVVSIDFNLESLQLAIKNQCRLIITHHPCIFPKNSGISKIVAGPLTSDLLNHQNQKENQDYASSFSVGASIEMNDLIYEALKQGIAVAALHTNFDRCALEVVDLISKGLNLTPKGRLSEKIEYSKLVVFVPPSHVDEIRKALTQAGAGRIGEYEECAFHIEGEGSFKGLSSTQPWCGKAGQLEKVKEIRLEMVFPTSLKHFIHKALRASHPYEEIAYDIYKVDEVSQKNEFCPLIKGLGYGFWGEYSEPQNFKKFAKEVKKLFGIDGFFVTALSSKEIKRVGFSPGKGSSFIESALLQQCDAYITGEVGYHNSINSFKKGLCVVELGHSQSEKFFIPVVKEWLVQLGLTSFGAYNPSQILYRGEE